MKQQLDRRSEVARQNAAAARARIEATLNEIRRRVDPRTIASETANGMLSRVNNLLGEASSTAKSRPWLVAVGATLVGVALTYRAARATEDDIEPLPKQPISPEKVNRRTKET